MNTNYTPLFAHDDKGGILKDRNGHNKMAGAFYQDNKVYLQFSTYNHIHHMDSAKLIDVAIYENLKASGCKYWRVELREGILIRASWQIPFFKLQNLIECNFIKKRKYPGYAEQYEIPLDEFNSKDHPIQKSLI